MSVRDPTTESHLWPRTARELAILTAVGALYFAAGKLGLRLAVVHPSATAVWAPSGIAVAAFLAFGTWCWPGVYAGALLVNFTTAGSLATSIGIATGNTLETLVAAALVRAFANGRDAFVRAIDVFWFSVLGGLLATTLAPTLGVMSLAAGGFARWSDFGRIWITWWLGDASGVLVVAPVLILWIKDRTLAGDRSRLYEASALWLCLLAVSTFLFTDAFRVADRHYPLQFLCIPVLLWAAFRFSPRETASATLILSAIATWGTIRGLGPFAPLPAEASLLVLQTFMAVTSMTMLVVTALVAERRQAVQARDDFFSIVGHELRTPLSTLMLQVENLMRGLKQNASPETLAARTDSIRRSGRRLTTLVDEMLNISRITSGVIPVALEPVELSAFIRDTANHFLDQMATADTKTALSAEGQVWCRTDPQRLGYVFNNLLANAIKYGAGHPIEIRVSGHSGVARLSIRDHGPGISREDQKRIFERFERAVSASHVSGFGLGLWIARRTVEALGGVIRVESAPGEGSTFSVELPLDPRLVDAAEPTRSEGDRPARDAAPADTRPTAL